MLGDGDGWAFDATGARYWGRHGAAGLLLRAPRPDGTPAVLLQHRAQWSHHGGTWGLPGGARDSHESPEQAAVREAWEEAGVPVGSVTVRGALVTARVAGTGGEAWSYTTVVADAPSLLATVGNDESTELRWVDEDDVTALPLHPAFARAWPTLRARPAAVTLAPADAGQLPRTLEVDRGEFLWCIPGAAPGVAAGLQQRIVTALRAGR